MHGHGCMLGVVFEKDDEGQKEAVAVSVPVEDPSTAKYLVDVSRSTEDYSL